MESEPLKLNINLEELRKRHLFIATPAYGGGMHSSYVSSLLQLEIKLCEWGIPHTVQFMYNESLISRARNKLVDLFLLNKAATDLLFIDADIEFRAEDVLLLMHFDKDVIGGAYPLKTIGWDLIKKAVLKNPDISEEDLPLQGAKWSCHPYAGHTTFNPVEPWEIDELATGFMLIKRGVFEKLNSICPSFKPAANDGTPNERCVDYFYVGVYNDKYESEDYSFCRKWHEVGGSVYLVPCINLNHHGSYPFKGNISSLSAHLGEFH